MIGYFTLPVWAVLTYHLIEIEPLESGFQHLLLAIVLEMLVQLVSEDGEEVEGVLLLSDVDRLPPELEDAPEALRLVVLQLALQEVAEDVLHLVEEALVLAVVFLGYVTCENALRR